MFPELPLFGRSDCCGLSATHRSDAQRARVRGTRCPRRFVGSAPVPAIGCAQPASERVRAKAWGGFLSVQPFPSCRASSGCRCVARGVRDRMGTLKAGQDEPATDHLARLPVPGEPAPVARCRPAILIPRPKRQHEEEFKHLPPPSIDMSCRTPGFDPARRK